MKTLILVRHAKSGWSNPSQTDFERTLTKTGIQDAEKIARQLDTGGYKIDSFISSPATRAQMTANIFMKAFKTNGLKLVLANNLYEASLPDYYDAIEKVDDDIQTLAVFAHNPGISDFINSLECLPVYNMPTSAAYGVELLDNHWMNLRLSKKQFLFFNYPKN